MNTEAVTNADPATLPAPMKIEARAYQREGSQTWGVRIFRNDAPDKEFAVFHGGANERRAREYATLLNDGFIAGL